MQNKNNVLYSVETDQRIIDFSQKYKFPGWFIDACGCYGCLIGKYLISIFINSCDNTMDITVDTIGKDGFFDNNVEWETPANEKELFETAKRFVKKYLDK